MALLAVLTNPYKEACAFMNVKAATPAEKDLLRLANFPQVRSKISAALARKRPIGIHISGPKGEFIRFRLTDPKKYQSFALMVLAPKWMRGMRPTEARQRLGAVGSRKLTLGVIGRLGVGKSELQSVLIPKARVFEVAQKYLPKPAARVAVNPHYPGPSANRRRYRRNDRWDNRLDTAWTGKKADYVSPVGTYGKAGYSELAMHTGLAGHQIVQFALWSDKDRWPYVTWAHVKTANGIVTDGTPHEVLPPEVLRSLPGDYARPKLPHGGKRMMFNPYEVVHRSTGRQLAVEATRGRARARARTMAGTYPAGTVEIRETVSGNRRNPGGGALNVPFQTGRKYKVAEIDRWVRSVGVPAIVKRWEQAMAQYKRFHKGSLPTSVAFNIQHLGVAKNITDVEFGVSEGKEWMAPYQVPKTSGKFEGDGSQGRYVHAHGDSEITVDIKRPVSTSKLPERFHTPDGKFVGVIPSRNVKITDWYRG